MGALLLPAPPVILTVAEELAGAAAGTAGAIVWLAGNLGGLVVALLVQALVHHPRACVPRDGRRRRRWPRRSRRG